MQDKRLTRRKIITYLCGGNELSPDFIRLLEKGGLTENDGNEIQSKLMEQLDSKYNLDLLFEQYYVEQLENKDDYPAEEMRVYRRDEEYLKLLNDHFPQSVPEAVDIIIEMLDEDDIEMIRNQEKDDFCIKEHFGLGLFMRNHFGIYKGQARSMLAEFKEWPASEFLLSDDISGFMLEAVWDEVQRRFGDNMDLESLYDECEDAYDFEEYGQLIEKCDEILERYPDEQKAISYKGIALCFLDMYGEALKVLKSGIERYPENYYMKNNIAMVYYDLGDYERSLKCCEEGLKIKDFDWLCENKMKALIRLGRMDEAIEFDKTLDHESCCLKDILNEKEFSQEALDYYYNLLKQNPDDIYIIDRIKAIVCVNNMNANPEVGDYYLKWIDSIRMVDDTKTCPLCGGELIPIVWGYPSGEAFEKATRGEIYLGGCIIDEFTNFHCNKCEKDFSIPGIACDDSRFDDYVHMRMFELGFVFNNSDEPKSLDYVRNCLSTFTDEEFDMFIGKLKEVGYITEPCEGFINVMKPMLW